MNPEWIAPLNLAYLAECLQYCENSEMLADLRAIAPAEALREATKRLSAKRREQIKQWVLALNSVEVVA